MKTLLISLHLEYLLLFSGIGALALHLVWHSS